jgi:hypothetical protein
MIRADLRLIQNPAETWAQMRDMKFSESYHRGLLNAGVPASKADEIASMVRQYISRISAGLETATYMLKELASEVDEARRLSGARLSDDGFRV